MHSLNPVELVLDNPGHDVAGLLHQGEPGMLLLAAALLGIFGMSLGAQAFFRGNRPRPTWGNLASNVGSAVWLAPIAAVFALYVFWMRPSLTSPDEASPAIVPVVAQTSASPSIPTGTKLPEWVKDKQISVGNTRLVVVTGEIGATVEEAATAGQNAAVELVRGDFSASYPQAAGWEPPASTAGTAIRRTFVEELDRKTVSSGVSFRVYRAHDQVELSPDVRKKIFPQWRDQLVGRRIWALGGLAGLLTLTFGTLATYFRLDNRTSGLYRRRLKLAAVSVIAAGGLAAVTLL